MLGLHWFFRMKRWTRHPPSARRVAAVAVVLAACVAIIAVERLGYWPDWMTADRVGRVPRAVGF